MYIINQLSESARFAWQSMKENLLRTMLSLLGVSVGVFSIITALTIVDSLKYNINERIDTFGTGLLYVTKWPWISENNYPWWKYSQWPSIKYREFLKLRPKVESAQGLAIVDGKNGITAKRLNNSLTVRVTGISYDYNLVSNVDIKRGRYYTEMECNSGVPVVIIGNDLVEILFPNSDPIGQQFKVGGRTFRVIAILAKTGLDLLDTGSKPDSKIFIPYNAYAKTFQGQGADPQLIAKAFDKDTDENKLEAELRGLMRALRSIRPVHPDNFSINRPDAIKKVFEPIFLSLTTTGWVISIFSILVGGLGIANMMFVSVTERRNIIGIQKSLGAKNYVILFQFLCEGVFLSVLGGCVGLTLVLLISIYPQDVLHLVITNNNIILGISISVVVGVAAGVIPAYRAATLNPVDAIRSK